MVLLPHHREWKFYRIHYHVWPALVLKVRYAEWIPAYGSVCKMLPSTHEDMSLSPRTQKRMASAVVYDCNPSAENVETGPQWPASQAYFLSNSRQVRARYLQNKTNKKQNAKQWNNPGRYLVINNYLHNVKCIQERSTAWRTRSWSLRKMNYLGFRLWWGGWESVTSISRVGTEWY